MTSGNNIETEYLEINEKSGWPAYFQKIRESQKNASTCKEASKPQNKILNRYRDVSPYDHSRVILNRGSTDYINANIVKVEKSHRQYILTQGPLPNTVSHFWLMVWEQKSLAVLMLNKLVEKKQEKCYQYWPSDVGAEMVMSDVSLKLEYLEQQDHSYFLTRVLKLTDLESGDSRNILQFHYITWPDFGVPSSPTVFLEFLRKVRDAGVLEESVGPAVVHCSAGIGRSGTFCLVDSCLVIIEKFGLNSVNVKEILLEMRNYRMGLIQTAEQLRFSYQAIIEGAKKILNPNSKEENHIELENTISHTSDGSNNSVENDEDDEDDDEPPPLPPPRLDSLKKMNGAPLDRPLPNIPHSVSSNELYENSDSLDEKYIPSGPLPVVPAGEEEEMSSEDELEEEDDDVEEQDNSRSESPGSDSTANRNNVSSTELRQRKRAERKQHLEAQVRDMKRRQQINEQWTQLKRPKTSLQD